MKVILVLVILMVSFFIFGCSQNEVSIDDSDTDINLPNEENLTNNSTSEEDLDEILDDLVVEDDEFVELGEMI
ncbi:MAG: hypothetical protein ACOC3X_00995 [Nanoarchaeota archaeon]